MDTATAPDRAPRARGLRRTRPGHRARGRARHRRPARARPPDADRPARQQPRPARGRAGPRQDDAGAHDRRRHRLHVQPDPVHAGPDAGRHHRHEHPHRGGWSAGLPVPAGPDLRQPRPRRRDQPGDAEDPVEPARGDAGAPGHGRAPALPARRRRSSSSRPRTRSRWRAPIPSPRRSSTGSCSRSWSRSRRRRTSSRSWTGRPAPESVTAAKVCTAAEIVEMQRLARAVPIAPHVTAYAVSVLAATHPDQPRAPGLVRDYVRYGGSPRGAQALVTGRQDLRAPRRAVQRLDRRHPGRRAAVAPPPDHPQLRGRGRGHHDRGGRPRRSSTRSSRRPSNSAAATAATRAMDGPRRRRGTAAAPAAPARGDAPGRSCRARSTRPSSTKASCASSSACCC